MIQKKIILIMIVFCCASSKKMYAITAAQAAMQQQILQNIEDVLSQKFDAEHYITWIDGIKKLVDQYKNITFPVVKKEVKVLENILSRAYTSEAIDEKIKKINDIKNDEIDIIEKEKTEGSKISPEQETHMLAEIEDLLKKDITTIDETTVQETTEYREWKFAVQKCIQDNSRKSEKIDKKLIELSEKLTQVEAVRKYRETINEIQVRLNAYHDSMGDTEYNKWKEKTEENLQNFDKFQKSAKTYNITISQEEGNLAQKLLEVYNKAEYTRKKN